MIDILVQYRWVFLIIAIVLLFAIIGFVVLGNKKKKAEAMKPVEVTPISQSDDVSAPSGDVVVPTNSEVPTSASPSLASEIAANPENFNVFASGNETDNMLSPAEEVVRNDEPTLVILDPSVQTTQEVNASNLTMGDGNSVVSPEVVDLNTPEAPIVPETVVPEAVVQSTNNVVNSENTSSVN